MEIIMSIVLFAFAIFCLVMAFKSAEQINERKAAYHRTNGYVSYSYHHHTLTITKRDPDIAKIFTIQPYRKTQYGYTPEKLIYTGATVGGITTGGWHKSGGFYARDRGNSGKVRLYYFHESSSKFIISEIERIELSPELARQAQSSDIAQYLSGNAIVIRHPVENMDAAVGAMQLGYKDVAFNIVEKAKIAASPTMEKVCDIINWLASCEPAPDLQKSPQKKTGKPQSKAAPKTDEKKDGKRKKRAIIISSTAIAATVICIALGITITNKTKEAAKLDSYNNAVALLEEGQYDDAISAFKALEDYGNSSELVLEASYRKALSHMEQGQYTYAIGIFESLDGYKDSNAQIMLAKQGQELDSLQKSYDTALEKAKDGDYEAACRLLTSLGSFSDSQQQLDLIADQWYQEMIAEFNTAEDDVVWIDVSNLYEIVYAAGGYQKAQNVLDYFGSDPMQGDSLYRRIKIACVEGNLHEAKALLEECGLLDLKPIKTLYDAVVKFAPYCGDFAYSSGDQSVLKNTTNESVNEVHTWVKFTINGETNTIVGFDLWIKHNDNQYGDYKFGAFQSDTNCFFRGVSAQYDYTVLADENGGLVFKKYNEGQLDQAKATVTFVPKEP